MIFLDKILLILYNLIRIIKIFCFVAAGFNLEEKNEKVKKSLPEKNH